jgi:four helix bundle protein
VREGRASRPTRSKEAPLHTHSKLVAHQVASQLIRSLRPLVESVRLSDASLADQLRRAASSVLLNIAEGNRRSGADRTRMFRIAAGSAAEVGAALEVASAWGYVTDAALVEVRPLLDRQLALLWGLTHRRG